MYYYNNNNYYYNYCYDKKIITRVKNNVCSGQASNSVSEADVKVSEKAMALKRCGVMEMRRRRNADSRGSSLMVLIRRPSS